jgi:GxxExxY protein
MGRELFLRGIECVPKEKVPILYKGERIYDHELEIDFYFRNKLVLELKAVEKLIPVHEAQLTYMKLTQTRLGILINFNVRLLKDGIKRMVL